MTALTDLLAALESGDRMATLDSMCAAIAADHLELAISSYDNTQAAIDFIKAALPEYEFMIRQERDSFHGGVAWRGIWHSPVWATSDTPARALLIAAVKALVAKEAGG